MLIYIPVYIVNTHEGFAMADFEALKGIDNFCKVLVKKMPADRIDNPNKKEDGSSQLALFKSAEWYRPLGGFVNSGTRQVGTEEPLIDMYDEGDQIRILVQCRCREQQVTFRPSSDGITICREECYREKGGIEKCNDVCRKLKLPTEELQLGDMQFVIAKCNNNNTLEALIPKKNKIL
jgi:hypothetical protein